MTLPTDPLAVIVDLARPLLDPSEGRRDGESESDHAFRHTIRNRRWEAKEDAIFDRIQYLASISGLPERAIRVGLRLARRKDRPRGRTLREVIENPPPPIRWIVPGIIREGLDLLSAVPKAGKSTMARGLALAVACGGKALGSISVEGGDVLLISLEDGESGRIDITRKKSYTGLTFPPHFRYRFHYEPSQRGSNAFLGLGDSCQVPAIPRAVSFRQVSDRSPRRSIRGADEGVPGSARIAMGIFQRDEVWWIDYYAEGVRKRERIGRDKRLAERVLEKRRTEVLEGRFLDRRPHRRMTLRDLAGRFLEYSRRNKPEKGNGYPMSNFLPMIITSL